MHQVGHFGGPMARGGIKHFDRGGDDDTTPGFPSFFGTRNRRLHWGTNGV